MPDQAQGLREFVGGDAMQGNRHSLPSGSVCQAYLWDDGIYRTTAQPGTTGLPKSQPDYRRLWLELKADLDRWSSVGGNDKPSDMMAAEFGRAWELMQRREEQFKNV